MPRIERLRQNTLEWQRWRLGGIGASDAPVLMGDVAFKTPRMLWSMKTGRTGRDRDNPAARRGRELEQLARRVYEKRIGIQMEPACLVHEELDWMRASLDGISFDGDIVLEIKCPWNPRAHQNLWQWPYTSLALPPAAASAGGVPCPRSALLVVRRRRRDAGAGPA